MNGDQTRIPANRPSAEVERTGPRSLDSRLALRPKEAAAALGISERTLRQLLPALPCVRLGRAVVLPVDLLQEWLRERARVEGSRVDAAVEEVLGDLRRER